MRFLLGGHSTLTLHLDLDYRRLTGNRAKDAVAAMIKRLAHRNANVQLYTLEVRLAPHFNAEMVPN
jgi:hypothetical protein